MGSAVRSPGTADGLYVDAQAEATWYDSDIWSASLGTTLANGNDGFGYALSIEAGQKIALKAIGR